ncbi:MAG: beta-N-acetylhexosaminidase [Janthinobacterium lividum]
MTRHEKIGQMLLFGWMSDAQADALVDELAVGGIILMGRNIGTPTETSAQIAGLQDRTRRRGLPPLFVAVDQEGGRVQRLKPPLYTPRQSQREIGTLNDPKIARQSTRSIGEELKSLGFNWDFAPVLDVDSNPQNPVIGNRAYSSDPHIVAALGVAAIQGFQIDAQILACGKHFPGHGDTETDSHLALPTIRRSREALDQTELIPFRAAIRSGLAALMTAHILFPALDPTLPATLSPAILTGLLREELGFDGLIITDDLEMIGVADHWGAPEAAVLAVQAGADLLLCCHEWETQRAIHAALLSAVETGRLTETRLDQSLSRITAAKAKWLAPALD